MELVQIIGLLCMASIAVLLVVFGYKEFKYRKKIEFLTHLIDRGIDKEKIEPFRLDVNKL